MSDTKLSVLGLDFYPELQTSQFVIPAGAGATFSATNNIATITTNAAHGLTFSPAAGVMPNFFIQFATAVSGQTGTGTLLNNIFRILTIPTTTTFTIYTTVTAATVTATTFNPVFVPALFQTQNSQYGNPNATGSNNPFPQVQSGFMNFTLGANCAIQYAPLNPAGVAGTTNLFLDGSNQPNGTPTAAPTFRNLAAASTNGQVWINPPATFIIANGTTATSSFSMII